MVKDTFDGIYETRDGTQVACAGYFGMVLDTKQPFTYDKSGNVTHIEIILGEGKQNEIRAVPEDLYGKYPLDLMKRLSGKDSYERNKA